MYGDIVLVTMYAALRKCFQNPFLQWSGWRNSYPRSRQLANLPEAGSAVSVMVER